MIIKGVHRILYKKAAVKALRKLPPRQRRQFEEAFHLLAPDPERRDLDVTGLTNRPGHRLRIGSWRAIYEVKDDEFVIRVLNVGARGDIYK